MEVICRKSEVGSRKGFNRYKSSFRLSFLFIDLVIFILLNLFHFISFSKIPVSVFRLRTPSFRLPTSVFQLLTSVFCLPTSVFRLPTSDFQLLTSVFRFPSSDFQPLFPTPSQFAFLSFLLVSTLSSSSSLSFRNSDNFSIGERVKAILPERINCNTPNLFSPWKRSWVSSL